MNDILFQTVFHQPFKDRCKPTGAGAVTYNGAIRATWLMRFFIPPALKGAVNMCLFCPQNETIGAVARLGMPPACDLPIYTHRSIADEEFIKIPWNEPATSLDQLRSQDWLIKNSGGSIGIMSDVDAHGVGVGEWLYVMILFGGLRPNIPFANLFIGVDADRYADWYQRMAWDADGNPPLFSASAPVGFCPVIAAPGQEARTKYPEAKYDPEQHAAKIPDLSRWTPEEIAAVKKQLLDNLLKNVRVEKLIP